LAYVEQKLGNSKKSIDYLKKAKSRLENWARDYPEDSRAYYHLSRLSIIQGDIDNAFKLLDISVNMGGLNYKRFMVEPIFDKIKKDPRFFKLIDRIKTIIDRERIEAGLVS